MRGSPPAATYAGFGNFHQYRGGVVVALELLELGLETPLHFGLGIVRSEQFDDLIVPEDFPEAIAAEDKPPASVNFPVLYFGLRCGGAADLGEQLVLVGMLRNLVLGNGSAQCVQLGDGMIQRAGDECLFRVLHHAAVAGMYGNCLPILQKQRGDR